MRVEKRLWGLFSPRKASDRDKTALRVDVLGAICQPAVVPPCHQLTLRLSSKHGVSRRFRGRRPFSICRSGSADAGAVSWMYVPARSGG